MTVFIALLRAVNVGGVALAMRDLKALCEQAGFARVRTYIASGNVLFESDAAEAAVKAELEAALTSHLGRPAGVMVRSAAELARVLAEQPFPEVPGNRAVAIFLDQPPPADWAAGVTGQAAERIAPGRRELYVHYPDGQGRSKLAIRAARDGTARNLNTVAKLVELAG